MWIPGGFGTGSNLSAVIKHIRKIVHRSACDPASSGSNKRRINYGLTFDAFAGHDTLLVVMLDLLEITDQISPFN